MASEAKQATYLGLLLLIMRHAIGGDLELENRRQVGVWNCR